MPLFIGLNVEEDLGPILLAIVRSTLRSFENKFPNDVVVKNDLEELLNANVRGWTG